MIIFSKPKVSLNNYSYSRRKKSFIQIQIMLRLSYPSCEIGRTLNAPQEVIWDLLTDTSRWPEWGPSVTAVECEGRYIKKGSRGRVRLPLGMWVPFVITEFDYRKCWAWKVWGVQATSHRIESLGEHGCRLIFELPFFAAPYLLICWIAIKRISNLVEHV